MRRSLLLTLPLLWSACAQDLKPLKQQWEGVVAEWTSSWHQAAAERAAKDLQARGQGQDDASAQQNRLSALLKTQAAALNALDLAVQDSRKSIDEAMKSGRIGTLTTAIEKATARIGPEVIKVREGYAALSSEYDRAAEMLSSGAGALEAKADAAADWAVEQVTALKHGGKVDFKGIQFSPGTAKLLDDPSAKAAIDELVAFVRTCPEVKVALTERVAKEKDLRAAIKLSQARADALKKMLIAQGVKATQTPARSAGRWASPARTSADGRGPQALSGVSLARMVGAIRTTMRRPSSSKRSDSTRQLSWIAAARD
jgi:outer membrane protein OmpA-like peptidoglycan-associated protein